MHVSDKLVNTEIESVVCKVGITKWIGIMSLKIMKIIQTKELLVQLF